MKIGFEYEGVILDDNGQITRWSDIPLQRQFRIKTKMDMMATKQNPCDHYDCLAEVRTEPLEDKSPRELLLAFRDVIQLADNAFQTEGYFVHWGEMRIPTALHQQILRDLGESKDRKKNTRTIVDGVEVQYDSKGNVWRGGGMHVSFSDIEDFLMPGVAVNLHTRLHRYLEDWALNSNYRNNLLWRHRDERDQNGAIVHKIGEYMTFGFNLADILDLAKWDEQSKYRYAGNGQNHPIHWMTEIHNVLTDYLYDETRFVDDGKDPVYCVEVKPVLVEEVVA